MTYISFRDFVLTHFNFSSSYVHGKKLQRGLKSCGIPVKGEEKKGEVGGGGDRGGSEGTCGRQVFASHLPLPSLLLLLLPLTSPPPLAFAFK